MCPRSTVKLCLVRFRMCGLGCLLLEAAFVRSKVRSFVPKFVCSFVPKSSFVRSFQSSFVPKFVPKFVRLFVPKFVRSKVRSLLLPRVTVEIVLLLPRRGCSVCRGTVYAFCCCCASGLACCPCNALLLWFVVCLWLDMLFVGSGSRL